jgi:hypothetical protein
MENVMYKQKSGLIVAACGAVSLGVMITAMAGDAPHSFEANPAIYKVLAENEHMRVVIATWQPGQKDSSHSHPMAAFYTIKDCRARITTPDGKVKEVNNKAGSARINPPVPSHTFENIGKTECQQVFVEMKK